MNNQEIINKTVEYVKSLLLGDSSGHDWWHVYRVWKMSIKLAEKEDADLFIVQLAALLHDIDDWKFNSHGEPVLAKKFMGELSLDKKIISDVCDIIKNLSFKGAGVSSVMGTKEGMVVQDADRLDAIGAIGIARTFAYGGSKAREIYDPEIKPIMHQTFEEYKKSKSPTINHFYEKLLLLKDRMNTKTAKKIAEHRHKFMEDFLEEFFKEWDGIN